MAKQHSGLDVRKNQLEHSMPRNVFAMLNLFSSTLLNILDFCTWNFLVNLTV